MQLFYRHLRIFLPSCIPALAVALCLAGVAACKDSPRRQPAAEVILAPISDEARFVFTSRAFLMKQADRIATMRPFGESDKGQLHVVGAEQAKALLVELSQSAHVESVEEGKGTLVVSNGQTASIEAIRELIYPVEFDPPEIPGKTTIGDRSAAFSVTPAHPVSFEQADCGLKQWFTPTVVDAGELVVAVRIESRTFDGFVNYGSPIQTSGRNWLGRPVAVTLTENRIEMPVFSSGKINGTVRLRPSDFILTTGIPRGKPLPVELAPLAELEGKPLSSTEAREPYELVLLTEVTLADR